MQPIINLENAKVFHGSNLDVLPTLPDNSIDSIVTDPPYELGFMGKKWDSTGIAYSVELWTECMRVLKPGGHLLAFGGSRTWHRLAVAIEDAGFEMRDSIAWLYGSGFPKSMDVSKAIDKQDATEARRKRDLEFTAWMRTTGLTASQINEITDTNMGGHYLTAASQPTVATAELFDKLRPYIPEVPNYIEAMVAERTIESENFKKREIIGQKPSSLGGTVAAGERNQDIIDYHKNKIVDITAPATPEAQKWAGWGTALKPAFEPVVVARKPLIGTVAENVLTYGTGGLNIDGSRIGRAEGDNSSAGNRTATFGTQDTKSGGDGSGGWEQNSGGRWPANIILDPYTAELLDEQSGNEVSRFFYQSKASKRDRNEGLDELPAVMARNYAQDKTTLETMPFGKLPKQNFHPTVKPTDLMRYLIKLVTPPGGVVLDPFTGSGSTGKAAILEGFQFVGIELTEEYLPIIEGRLKWADKQAREQEEKKDEALF